MAKNNKVEMFREVTREMADTYERKNSDYGDSFGESIREFGLIAGVVRISDKINRLKSLVRSSEIKVREESISDTLLDAANYCIMLRMEIGNNLSNRGNNNERVR